MTKLLLLGALAAVLMPVAAWATPPPPGTPAAALAQANADSAAASCRAEQADPNFAGAHGGKTFAQFYGTGHNAHNAFGKCISMKAQASAETEAASQLNPAQTCRAERTKMGLDLFRSSWGKNANDSNAFGKCVAAKAQLQATDEQNAATACRAEQADTGFAAAHGGKTFDQFYGTNDNLSNAFGKCVSQKAHAASAAHEKATISAAKACRTERNAGVPAFAQKYGTFGHCVSLKAHGH